MCRVNKSASVLAAPLITFSFLWPESHLHNRGSSPVPRQGLCFPHMTLPNPGVAITPTVKGM